MRLSHTKPLITRLEEAFARRMGASTLPLSVRQVRPGLHRVTDRETGSWAEFDTACWRIRRLAEHDASAPSP